MQNYRNRPRDIFNSMQTKTSLEFKHFIRIIGRGQRAGKTLSQSEAYQAMKMLINGEATQEQRGAFLMLLRVREETAEELAGFTQAFREHCNQDVQNLTVDLDMGCYAGKRRHLPWFILSVIVLAQTGKKILLHGTHEPDSKRLYLREVLPQLGLSLANNAQQAQQQLAEFGFSYLELAYINPQLDEIIQLREQFGLRSCANTIARMLNPASSVASLQGVFHRGVDEKHAKTAEILQEQNTACFRGEGGEIEFNPERDVKLYVCHEEGSKVIDIDALLQNQVTKPKTLDCQVLKEFWRGEQVSPYGTNAVIGTLATMLVLLEKVHWQDALKQADDIWQNRSKTWPLGEIETGSEVSKFTTSGKHYAH